MDTHQARQPHTNTILSPESALCRWGGPSALFWLEEARLQCRGTLNPHWAFGGPHDSTSTSTSQPASQPVPREKTNKPKSLLFFLFPPRLGEKSAVETLFTYFPTRTSEAGESHGTRYTVGSRTHARPGPSGTGTLRLGRPLVRTHVVFSFSALQKGTLGHSGRGQGVSGTRRQVWCQCVPHWDKFTRPGRGGGWSP